MNASAIFHYNRSELYVFGVWILSSALITAPKKILWPKNRERIGASEVRVMQKQLTLLGYNTFGIDGKFGFNSKKALIDFQKDIKQTPDGHPDRSIFKRLLSTLTIRNPDTFCLRRCVKKHFSLRSCVKPINVFQAPCAFYVFCSFKLNRFIISSSEKDQTAFTSI